MRLRPRRPGRMRVGPPLFGAHSALNPRRGQNRLLAALAEANRLFEQGQHAQAAPLFARLAGEAERRQVARQAVRLNLRAGESYALAGDANMAVAHARRALNILLEGGREQQAAKVLRRFTEGLRQKGFKAQADALEREYQGRIRPAEGINFPGGATAERGRLPANCPHCGAAVRSDEVEWIDDHSAECAYCGNVIAAE